MSRSLSRLVKEIRSKYGSFEYLAVVELTTGKRTLGHRPHLHLLARGPAIARHWLSARWAFHTKGSFRVDIQRVGDRLRGALYSAGEPGLRGG